MNWYVLYTKSRSEKAVAEKLASNGVESYCPVLKIKKKWSDRWKWVEEPLFRSYCFVYINDVEREYVLTIPGVVRYVYFCGQPAVVRDQEINVLKHWLVQYSHDHIICANYVPTDKVRLKNGLLADQSAEVLKSVGNYVVLHVEGIGMEIKVDLRKNIVEKVIS